MLTARARSSHALARTRSQLGVAVLVLCCAIFVWRHFGHHINPPIAMHHHLDEDEEDVEGLAGASPSASPSKMRPDVKHVGGLTRGASTAARPQAVVLAWGTFVAINPQRLLKQRPRSSSRHKISIPGRTREGYAFEGRFPRQAMFPPADRR